MLKIRIFRPFFRVEKKRDFPIFSFRSLQPTDHRRGAIEYFQLHSFYTFF